MEEKLRTRKGKQGLVNLIRYADDFLITGRTKELLETEVIPIITAHLKERGLELSSEKTKITHIDKGFDFLGQNIRKYKNGAIRKFLIKPSEKNTNSFLDKVREIIGRNPTMKAGELVRILNPIIRGWANYHRHIVAKVAFNTVDSVIYRCLWNWAKRRHPNKNRRWIVNKYFTSVGGDNWVFSGTINGRDGKRANRSFNERRKCANQTTHQNKSRS